MSPLALSLLEFLYASMPMSDSVDYSREFWAENIECSLRAREEMPWGSIVPDREFRHFVLPVRVNNEDLDHSRIVFYDELRPRLAGLTMAEAALEVNHWCHEHVTYQPSDARTSSPLASVRTAYGRCGEESTFLVAALRSVGIPARQVYTPRWAHTDDNHAWVEAWVDGAWHFMGACEPEAVLDLGWFNAPASRAMLMHTKAFGAYDGPEEVMQRTACYTEIDVTSNYAPVSRRYVRVTDVEGRPVANASVEFKIYNYAEFYTVATHQTDEHGLTSMQAGCGDLVAWAYKDGCYGFERCTIGPKDTLQLCLNHRGGEAYSADIDIVPPAERNTVPPMTELQRQTNALRLVREDSIRNAYVATFPDSPMSDARANRLVRAARGNYQTLIDYLRSDLLTNIQGFGLNLLESLSAKDLRDVPADVLMDHTQYSALPALLYDGAISDSLFFKYVACPRVANERLTPFRSQLLQAWCGKSDYESMASCFEQGWRQGPEALVRWVTDSIRIDDARNPQRLCMSPMGVYRHRVTDSHSRDIFFVALARTFGFPARIDEVTGKVQYLSGEDKWVDVWFEQTTDAVSAAVGQLSVSWEPTRYVTDPKYYTHFTLSRLDAGCPVLLNYDEDGRWSTTLREPQTLDAGDYLLTTGTRLADGSVLAHVEAAPLAARGTLQLPLAMRQASSGKLQVIGALNSEHLYRSLRVESGHLVPAENLCSILSTTGRGFYILGLIEPSHEPSNHTLMDIARCSAQLDEWGGHLILLLRSQTDADRFDLSAFPALPYNTHFGIDADGAVTEELHQELHLTESPVFVIADTFNRVVYHSEGYTIGLGDRLVEAFK